MSTTSPIPMPPAVQQSTHSSETTIEQVSFGFFRIARRLLPWLQWSLAAIAVGILFLAGLSKLLLFTVVAAPLALLLQLWLDHSGSVLPILPSYLAIQSLVYLLPLAGTSIPSAWFDRFELTSSVAGALFIWLFSIGGGWFLTSASLGVVANRSPLGLAQNQPLLAHQLLGLTLLSRFIYVIPEIWSAFGAESASALALIRVVGNLAASTGGFLGAYRWSIGALPVAWTWWLLLGIILFQSFATLLLSSAQVLIFSVLLGLWLGRPKRALPVTLMAIALVAVLQQGKAVLRNRYWEEGTGSSALVRLSPTQLVQEWLDASFKTAPSSESAKKASLVDRVSNLYNLFYVADRLESGTPTMDGGSLAVIPKVLVPRFLNPTKVRGQEGQVLLNLHFGRQRSRRQTQTTYIAWGFLPEAVGNYGLFMGPLLYGLTVGALIRICENLGRYQTLLSSAGLLSLGLSVIWISSYEMVASTFVGSAAQIVVLIVILALAIGSGSSSSTSRR
ncbi:MAG: hypothetical protein ACODUE_04295 [Synechococcus sp.]